MLWVKALHIMSVIAWMSALLYLPRLMVYHADAAIGSEKSETFKVMERRLLRGIANPAMAATWIFGLWLAWWMGALEEHWLHAKFLFVVLLSAYHGMLVRYVRAFAEDRNVRTSRFFRMINEIPALFIVVIVILVVVKPF
jgi:putative membrane protein